MVWPLGLIYLCPIWFHIFASSSWTVSLSCIFVLFYFCCSHAEMLRTTLVHEFYFSITVLNWTWFFYKRDGPCLGWRFTCLKLTVILIVYIPFLLLFSLVCSSPQGCEQESATLRKLKQSKRQRRRETHSMEVMLGLSPLQQQQQQQVNKSEFRKLRSNFSSYLYLHFLEN